MVVLVQGLMTGVGVTRLRTFRVHVVPLPDSEDPLVTEESDVARYPGPIQNQGLKISGNVHLHALHRVIGKHPEQNHEEIDLALHLVHLTITPIPIATLRDALAPDLVLTDDRIIEVLNIDAPFSANVLVLQTVNQNVVACRSSENVLGLPVTGKSIAAAHQVKHHGQMLNVDQCMPTTLLSIKIEVLDRVPILTSVNVDRVLEHIHLPTAMEVLTDHLHELRYICPHVSNLYLLMETALYFLQIYL